VFRTILLPYDGSDTARAIVPTVTEVARRWASEVVVYRCLEEDDGERGSAEARRSAEALADALRVSGLVAQALVSRGRPAEAIAQAAADAKATCIAMSTHGRTGLSRWALGSVAERVVRTSPLPVLLSRAMVDEEQPPSDRIEHVLVPFDGTDEGLRVVEPIADLLRSLEAHATLLHCVSDYRGKEAMETGQRNLDRAERAFGELGVEVTTALRRGHPAVTIVDYGLFEAGQERPDLVAMATHARRGVPRMLLGSVTEKVMRSSVIPLLVLPPPRPD
jgi:nucleotide-binding universal stress UspA family protein